nr:hypothetical protein [Sedimentibacter sp.]
MGLARELAIELVKKCRMDENDIKKSLKHADISLINNKYAQKRIKEFISKFC